MLRKSLFWGLTLMLVAVLVWLIINGRKEEVRAAKAPSEIVKTAKSSFTRVVRPGDLEAVAQGDEIKPRGADSGTQAQVVIRNRGNIAYHNVMLKLAYLGAGGKILSTRNRLVSETIEAGQTLTVGDIAADGVTPGTARCQITILYADLAPASKLTGK